MATSAQEAEQQVIAARQALGGELDELSAAARSAVDIPAKVRKNPVQTAALAGGAGFLLVGGPKRVLRAVAARVRPQRRERRLLPNEIERAVKHAAGPRAPEVEDALEEEFAEFLKKKAKQDPPASPAQSLWKTYDALVGPLAALGARQLAARLFAADTHRPPASSEGAEETGGSSSKPDAASDSRAGSRRGTAGGP
jgi:hypothetical protein